MIAKLACLILGHTSSLIEHRQKRRYIKGFDFGIWETRELRPIIPRRWHFWKCLRCGKVIKSGTINSGGKNNVGHRFFHPDTELDRPGLRLVAGRIDDYCGRTYTSKEVTEGR